VRLAPSLLESDRAPAVSRVVLGPLAGPCGPAWPPAMDVARGVPDDAADVDGREWRSIACRM
jgi:hypothetical protein